MRRVLAALAEAGDADVALPHAGGFPQPLAAAYRTDVVDAIERRIAAGRLRLVTLFDVIRVRGLDAAALLADPALAAADPDLGSVVNVNEPADYEAARARPAPARHGGGRRRAGAGRAGRDPRRGGGRRRRPPGARLDGASVNGAPVTADAEFPLVEGDAVAFGAPERIPQRASSDRAAAASTAHAVPARSRERA